MKHQPIDLKQILDRIDLVDLANRAGARLKKVGGSYRGTCPLHGGDNASAFHVYTGEDKDSNDNRQRWHCHTGCQAGGDAIEFVQRWQRLPNDAEGFLQAVRYLADLTGIPLAQLNVTPEQARAAAEKRQIQRTRQEILTLAARYYAHLLRSPAGQPGLDYALGRGWTRDTIKNMGLGYSDGQLLAHLREQDVSLDQALATGVITRRDVGEAHSLADTIPAGHLIYVHFLHKVVTYLSGRSTTSNEQARKARNMRGPKQLYWALQDNCEILMVVEGQADALTAWQWGYNAVALCGASLNDKDVEALKQYRGVYLALDADAGDKVAGIADQLGPLTMILAGVPAKDLNDWLVKEQGTAQDLGVLIQKAKSWIDTAIDRARKAPPYDMEDEIEHLAGLVARLGSTVRGHYVREICDRYRLSNAADFRELVDSIANEDGEASNGFEIIGGRFAYYGEPLCNWTGKITHELAMDDGLNPPEILFTAVGTLDTNEPLEAIDVKAEDFDALRWVPRHWGARPVMFVSPGKSYLVRRAIQEASRDDLVRERVHTFTGWAIIDGKRTYLTASGGLNAESLDPNVRVDLGNNNLGRYALPAPPADLRPAIRASLEFLTLAPYGVTLPLWAAMYAAPLSPLKTLNAILWVYGTTQSGKSTISHLALAHFGPTFIDGHEYRAPKDWTSTPTDLERAMFVTKDAPIIIDDYAPSHSGAAEASQMAKKAHYVVRSVGNRSSRGRANADLSERQQRPPRGMVIATAENPLVGQSIVGRMIYVPVEAGQVIQTDNDKRSNGEETDLDKAQRQAMAGLYAEAMAGYVTWLAANWDRLEHEIPSRIDRASRAGRALLPSNQSRLSDYYGLLVTASHLALEYAHQYGALSADDMELQMELCRHHLVELLRSQADRVDTQSPVLKFFQALSDLLAQKKIYFAPRKGTNSAPPNYQAELVGWYDEEHVYLLTNVALAHAKAYWHILDERFDTLADALRRELWQQKFVVGRDGKNFEQKPYINKDVQQRRVLVLDAQMLAEKASINPAGLTTTDEPD